MKKIVLLSPPYLPEYMRNARCDFVSLSGSQWYPIWLGYCGAFLEKRGYEVKLIDAPSYGLTHVEAEDIITKFGPDFLVIYTGRLSENNDVEFSDKLVSKLGIKGAFVGPYISIDPERSLQKSKNIFIAVKGEFEYPILEIIEGKQLQETENIVYNDNGTIRINPLRPLLERDDLDEMPFVTEFFSRHLEFGYYKAPSEHLPFIDIMTGRGCKWGVCTYCLWVHSFIRGSVYNTRSVGNVVEEFKFIKTCLPQIRSIMLQDDTMTEERAKEISEALLSDGVRMSWSCYARGDLSCNTLRLMKRAGCRNLHVGYESANRNILKNIKKGLTKEEMTAFSEDAKSAGLNIHGDFAVGFPGETKESIKETIEWACMLQPNTAQFQLMIPFRGTPFYKELDEKEWFKDGAPNYPEITKEEMEEMVRKAYRKFYFSISFVKEVIKHPYEMFFSRLGTYYRAVKYLLWKDYIH